MFGDGSSIQANTTSDFLFAVDFFERMNQLKTKPQRKGTLAHEMYSKVNAFRVNLKLFFSPASSE